MTPFAGEREFAGTIPGFGDTSNMSVIPGVCHPHAPQPLATVKRLQTALRGLSERSRDTNAATPVDGLVGPHTLRAVNYAVPKYASSDPLLASGRLTHPQIVSFAPQLASAIERAPIAAPAAPQMQAPPPAPASGSSSFWQTLAQGAAIYAAQQNPGGRPMPGYPPAYGYGPPARAAAGRASTSSAFIPARVHEHVRFNPTVIAFGIGAVVVTVLVMQKREQSGGK